MSRDQFHEGLWSHEVSSGPPEALADLLDGQESTSSERQTDTHAERWGTEFTWWVMEMERKKRGEKREAEAASQKKG